MTVCQSIQRLADLPLSGASPLPHWSDLVSTRDRKLTQFNQGVPVFTGRQGFQALDRTGHVITRQLCGVVQGARSFYGLTDAFQVFDPAFWIA